MTPAQKKFHALLYHERSRFFLQKFSEELGACIFCKAMDIPYEDAQSEAIKLGHAMDSYSRKLYHMEIKARRFNKSYARFILQPEVTALRLIYVLNTMYAAYPHHYHKLFAAVSEYIFTGTTAGGR